MGYVDGYMAFGVRQGLFKELPHFWREILEELTVSWNFLDGFRKFFDGFHEVLVRPLGPMPRIRACKRVQKTLFHLRVGDHFEHPQILEEKPPAAAAAGSRKIQERKYFFTAASRASSARQSVNSKAHVEQRPLSTMAVSSTA